MLRNRKDHHTTENNKGMTLIELIVAVVIFAIAIVPMLYAFVYSTGYSFRAQQTFQSTGIAQAIIEKAKAPGVTMSGLENAIISSDLLDSGVFSVETYPDALDNVNHTYMLDNVRAINNEDGSDNRRMYDVQIILEAKDSKNTSTIRSMSSKTANFTDNNAAFTPSLLLYEDQRAVNKLIELIKLNTFCKNNVSVQTGGANVAEGSWPIADPSVVFTEADIDKDDLCIRRVINITATSSGVVLSVDYYCGGFYEGGALHSTYSVSKDVPISGVTYTITCTGNLDSDSNTYTVATGNNYVPPEDGSHTPFYSAEYGGDNDFTLYSGATDALFFYYYPGYQQSSNDTVDFFDTFIVKNSVSKTDVTGSDGHFSMYFYKQYNSGSSMTATQYNHAEWNYAPYFKFKNTGTDMAIDFYNNFLYDVRVDDFYNVSSDYRLDSHGGSFANKLQPNGTSTLIDVDGDFNNMTLKPTGSFFDWNSLNLPHDTIVTTYTVTVNIFKDGETTPIETMSGEVINW